MIIRKLWYKCQKCSFQRVGKNIIEFEDMKILKDCVKCGGHFKLQCPECGMINKTKWIEVNE